MGENGTVIVETKVVGQKLQLDDVLVEIPPGTHQLEDLIRTLVSRELERFERTERAGSVLRVLTPADLAEGASTGKYTAEARARQAAPGPAEAQARALEAFTDHLYFVFVDEVAVESLDEVVTVTAETRLRLIRLVALAGG